jgi:predicted AlkP superfamily phosphohydrolase/phosphomutase
MAERTVTFFGEEVKLKDTVPAIYRQVDRIVGETLDRIKAGEFGDNCTLIVVSDHGFAPYYYGVNLNNFLAEKGYLELSRNGEPLALDDLDDFREPDIFKLADWKNTRAYSLGLGKIFVNLAGREADGVVTAEEYDAVVESIVRDLEAYVDPATGKRIVKKAFRREEIFSGDFWKEGEAEFSFNRGSVKEMRRTDGFADIYLGFSRGYRVSWQTTLGGLEEATIVYNELKWSGDHVSVMPDDVAGVFFSNAAMETAGRRVSVVDVVPTVYTLFGIPVPEGLDGTAVAVTPP